MLVFQEVIEVIITILVAGYILQPLVKDGLKKSFLFAGISIVLHELGHKFTALFSGFNAVYHANYSGLGLGVLLRLLNAPVFFVPAYVSISGNGSVIGYLLTALAGPLVNLLVCGACFLLLSQFSHVDWVQRNAEFINSLRVINLWLALLNLLPIPGTDGFHALASLRSL